ncbi:uncharacterized protein [Haliotis cracherodii]|uniref:uncharacterized protein n=1 Tax=Haliotis cracherodii TaxID=6455 RepID=UPI0039E8EF36
MASLCVLVLLVAASSVVHGHENIAAVVNQMSLLEKEINHLKVELNHLKSDVPGMETRVINKMDILELLLRLDLTEKIVPSYIRSQIESLDATVNIHVMSQIRHLKRGYQQMKRQTLSLTRQLREVGQTKTRQPLDTVKDKDACEQQVSELKTELNVTRHHVTHVEKDVSLLKDDVLIVIRQSADVQAQINETQRTVETLVKQNVRLRNDLIVINASLAEDVQTLGNLHLNYVNKTRDLQTNADRTQPIQHYTPTTPSGRPFSSVATTPTTREFQDKTRILIVRYGSVASQHPHQITIDKNDMKTYPHLYTKYIEAVTYEPVSRRLIFSRMSPPGIFSSRLDVSGVTTLREGIQSYGMTVDVDRQLIFLTTYHPTWTISRMSTFGRNFRGIVNLRYRGSYIPNGIAVDSRKKMIYFCKKGPLRWHRISTCCGGAKQSPEPLST